MTKVFLIHLSKHNRNESKCMVHISRHIFPTYCINTHEYKQRSCLLSFRDSCLQLFAQWSMFMTTDRRQRPYGLLSPALRRFPLSQQVDSPRLPNCKPRQFLFESSTTSNQYSGLTPHGTIWITGLPSSWQCNFLAQGRGAQPHSYWYWLCSQKHIFIQCASAQDATLIRLWYVQADCLVCQLWCSSNATGSLNRERFGRVWSTTSPRLVHR